MPNLTGYWTGMLAAGAAAFTVGCSESRETGAVTSRSGGETSSAPGAEAVEERDHALIRAVNAIPGQATVTIYAGDSAAFKDVTYQRATGYQEIPDDLFDFQLRRAPAGEAVAQNRENLRDGGRYTVVALPSEDPDDENLRVLDDDLEPITDGKARVRFINGMAGGGDVDLFVRGQKDPIFDGINSTMEAEWKEVDPVSGTLVVKPGDKDATLASLPNTNLEPGKGYTFVVVGRPGKYDLLKIEDDVGR